MTSDTIITRYRPETWKQIVGHQFIIRSMKKQVEEKTQRCFLLSGLSGTGKTTIARIAAKAAGCDDIVEVDAVKFSGVDDIRQLTRSHGFTPLNGGSRALILNEVHRLSATALDALLIPLEEPSEWTWWFLTTTDPAKVAKAIHTRCTHYTLKALSLSELREVIEFVLAEEDLELPDEEAIVDMCCKHAEGSARAAVNAIAKCFAAQSKDEARELLQRADGESGAAIDLVRALVGGTTWPIVKEILSGLKEKEEDPESVRHVVRAYVTAVLLKGGKDPKRLFAILEAFSQPFPRSDGVSPLVLACGKLLFG